MGAEPFRPGTRNDDESRHFLRSSLLRKRLVHPFGTIKHGRNQSAFLMRRLDNVRGEFSLTALAYNIRRAISLIGVPGLIAAAKG